MTAAESRSPSFTQRSNLAPSSAILARSIVFNVLLYTSLLVHGVVGLPSLALPYPITRVFIRSCARTSLWLLRVVCGTGVEWRGLDKIPSGACIIASKHQSIWDIIALLVMSPDPVFILKRELMWIPLLGWYIWKAGMIPINRNSGLAALTRMTERARQELKRSRQLIIFPEGTRRPPGAAPSYKSGIAHLYHEAGVPCVPLALNSGLFWPRRSFLRFPGTIVVEALEPIEPGLASRIFLARLESVLEAAAARLVPEGGDQGSGIRGRVP
jgi:1-acyl-sn-glycerol-3-phosphate acyltransferase